MPGQLILRFQPGLTPEEITAFYQEYGLSEMEDLNRAPEAEAAALKLAFVPVEVNPSFIEMLERDPRVVYAEPNYIVQVSQTPPNDPDFGKLWGLRNTGQTGGVAGADISALEGWGVTTGADSVVVVVIDTGVDYTHEDLGPNMWVNKAECPQGYGKCEKNGADEDNNGYVDDFYGINAITGTGDPMDDYGHGTHVAGTIGAQGGNSLGVVGVNQNISIVACKFLSASGGGTVADAVKCFNYVDQLKNAQNVNIVATNNSWGGGAPSQALEDAMSGADQPLHICAAGNSNSNTPHYPAAYDLDHIVSVAATDHSDLYADFSNYGPWVDMAAPGDAIYSTMPKGSCPICDPSGYGTISGTSMATPHVAGAVALIAAKYPTLDLMQIRQRILTGVDPLADTSKDTLTNGRLNVFNTLEEDETPPAPISDVAVSALFMTQVALSWTATGDDGSSGTANLYDVRYATTPISPETWASATQASGEPKPQAPGSKETFTVGGLEPNTTYYFALQAVDNVGNVSTLSNIVIGKTSAGTVVFGDDMENGAGDWVTAGTDDLWHLSEHRANSPTHAWYYGDETTRRYDTGGANSGTLTSPPIELTTNADVLLTFYEWSQLESSAAFDRTRVQLSTDGGTTWATVFESHGTSDQWQKRAVSLTEFVGDANTIHVRFWFDTIDNRFNAFEGWYVDDVAVLVAQPGQPGTGPSLPNLVMLEGNLGFSHPAPVAGDEVTVYAAVLNTGGAEANAVQVQFMDASGETAVPLGAPQTLANLVVGGSASAQIKLDTTGKVGSHTIQVVVDPYNLIAETNEGDNQAQRAYTVTAPSAPNLAIDMSNIAFNPASPQPGDQVTIHAVVRNDGALAAEGVVAQFLDTTDSAAVIPIGAAQPLDFLAPGGIATAQVTYDTTGLSGDRKIKVVIDPQNALAEGDESDNAAQVTLSLARPPLPNLSLSATSVGFDPLTPSTGQTVTVAATVVNDGDRPATNVVVQFMDTTVSALPIGEPQIIAAIPPGGSGVAQVLYPTLGLAGDRKIEITVDPYNFIQEERETDNQARTTLTIQPPPIANLTVAASGIGFHPKQPVQGDEVTVTAVIRNTGDARAAGITVQFFDVSDGVLLPIGGRQSLAEIGPGASATAQVSYATAGMAGTRRIQVVVDPNNFVVESNEGDNEAALSLTVAPPPMPNLSMAAGNIVFDPPQPTEGDVVTITAVALNTGAAPAARILVQFVDVTNGAFDPIGLEQTIESIPPGGSATAQVVYATADKPGSRKIQLLVDSNNLIAETDENDNEAVTTLAVTPAPLPNLVVRADGVGFNPSQPTAGEALTVTVTVHNQGAAAAESVVVQLLDVSDGEAVPVGAAQTVAQLAPGAATALSWAYGAGSALLPGERTLRVVVDPGNFVVETDETDNRVSLTLLVAPAHLPNVVALPSNLGFVPMHPVDGDAVMLTMTLLNAGAAPATDVLVQFVDVTDGAADPIGAKQTIPLILPGQSAIAQVTYDTTGKAGERRIRVVADPHMILAESAENDNEAVGVLRVAPAPLPDIAILAEHIGFSAATAAPGDVVTVTATLLNLGSVVAENVVVQFVDASNNGNSPITANQVISAIAPGGAASVQIAYGTRGRFGERRIQVVVDPNNLLVEQDENNNRALASFRVQTPAAANLVMRATQIGFDPGAVGAEGTVNVYATVRNDGGVAVGEVSVTFLDVTDGGAVPIGAPQTLPGIGPGGSGMVQVVYAVPAGTTDRKVQVVVDPNNTIAESSESDNQATATLPRIQAAQPNLMLTTDNVTFSPGNPREGATVTVRAVVINNGALAADNVVVQFTDTTGGDGTPIGPQQVIPTLAPGSSATVQVSYPTAGKLGSRSIRVAVDPNNFIAESRETDNTATVTLEVRGSDLSNLVVVAPNVNFSPPAPTVGTPVMVRAVILNHGAREARDVVVQFMDVSGGSQLPIGAPQTIARIAPGAGALAQISYTPAVVGEATLQVVADPNNFIVEADENDNRAQKSLVAGAPPAPNLVALSSNLEFAPNAPQDGNLVVIQATVLNNGTAPTTDVVVRIEDVTDLTAPVLIGRPRLIDALAAGASEAVQVTYDTTDKAGERRIRLTVDPANTVEESDESDNQAIALLQVAPPPSPNLVVRAANVRFAPAAPTDGQAVTVTVTVLNEGERNASRVEVQVLDVTNGAPMPVGDVQMIGGIPSGGSGMVQVVYDTTGKEGSRTLRVVVDPANLIKESSENDNQVDAPLTVAPVPEPGKEPNLTITGSGVSFTPTLPMPGDLVTVTVVVRNSGEGDASGVVVRVTDTTDDEPVQVGDDVIVPALGAGQTATVTVAYDTTGKEGSRTLTATADPDNSITETNENDNSATVTIPVGGGSGGGEETPSDPSDTGEGAGSDASTSVDPRLEPAAPGVTVQIAPDQIRRGAP